MSREEKVAIDVKLKPDLEAKLLRLSNLSGVSISKVIPVLLALRVIELEAQNETSK